MLLGALKGAEGDESCFVQPSSPPRPLRLSQSAPLRRRHRRSPSQEQFLRRASSQRRLLAQTEAHPSSAVPLCSSTPSSNGQSRRGSRSSALRTVQLYTARRAPLTRPSSSAAPAPCGSTTPVA